MAEENTTAPVTTDAPSPEQAPDAPEPTREQKVDRAIEKTLKAGKAKERAAKGVATKAAKAAATKEPPAPAPGAKEPPPPPPPAAVNAPDRTPREMLEAGDLEAAFEAAFGKKPQDFKIDSRRWEEWRKASGRARADIAKRESEHQNRVERERGELATALSQAERKFAPLIEAHKLYSAGDAVGAVKALFGDDVPAFQRKLLASYHGKSPELESVRQELQELRAEQARREQEKEQRAAEEREREQVATYLGEIREALIDGPDPELASLATRPRFLGRILQIQRQNYDRAANATIPIAVAADMAREEIVTEFGGVFGRKPRDTAVPVETDRAGSKLARPTAAGATVTNISRRGATEVSANGRKPTVDELVNKYTALAQAESR